MDAVVPALADAMVHFGGPHPSDVVVLVTSHKEGLDLVAQLEPQFGPISHVFGDTDEESRTRKHAFWMGTGGLKMSTIHSFKGWELDNVVLIWPPGEYGRAPRAERDALFYTALSRGMRNLVVVNADRSYDTWSADWDSLPGRQGGA